VYGWRARIGLIIPSLNVTAEPEFYRLAPLGVSVHTSRLLFEKGTAENLEKMADDTDKAAYQLATACVDVIAYACTTGSLIKGLGWDREIINLIEKQTRIPATTTSTAAIEAFSELGVRRVAVATPYIRELNDKEQAFFEGHGVEVVNIEGLGYTSGEDLHREPPTAAYKLAKRVNRNEADCVFISCTDFKSIEILDVLEKDLGKPVLCSNTVTLWAVLKRIGLRQPIEGYGEILRRL
jgi:maleate isomerase